MFIKSLILILFFSLMIGVGIYCRRHTSDVNGFVLGGRSVGPWLTAFAYGTSYFSAVIFVGYAGQFGWKFGLASTWVGLGNAFISLEHFRPPHTLDDAAFRLSDHAGLFRQTL